MRYVALAADYDGTLATHGTVDEATFAALERLRDSGRKLIMVTGRELDELMEVCPRLDLFDRVVAENGALLYDPATRAERALGESPPEEFVRRLKARGAERVSVGRVIVATWEPAQTVALEIIQEMGLELQVIFNKGAVMILPSGINKAFGLYEALEELKLSRHNVVAVGDAENDHAFFNLCECSAAVSNALPALKERADIVTERSHGAGVTEVIDRMIDDDLASLAPRLTRHAILIGHRAHDEKTEEHLAPYGRNVLVAGTSGSGKSTLTTGLLERLCARGYQFVIIDPEGDYEELEECVMLGDPHRAPLLEEILSLVDDPRKNVSVNLLGIALEHRPAFFAELLPRLQELRSRTGRPHWIIVDEAHHLLPATWDPATMTLPQKPHSILMITVHPESVAPEFLKSVDMVLAVGQEPDQTLIKFSKAIGVTPPELEPMTLESGEALVWRCGGEAGSQPPVKVRSEPPKSERSRHGRKYAEGNLGPDRSFRFRGPEGKLDLKAQNLTIFLQMADGVDDATWLHHLENGDYATWFREQIKDDELAEETESIARREDLDPQAGRAAIREAIERNYTLPADSASGEVDGD